MVERPDDGLGDVAPGLQDPAVPLRRRVPGPRRAARTSPATWPSTSTASTSRRRSTSASTSPTRCPSARPSRHGSRARTSLAWPSSSSSARRRPRRSTGCTRCGARAAPPPSTCSARRRSSAAEADRYQARVLELLDALCAAAPSWAPDDHLERDDLGPLPRVNVSIKPTALATHYEPLSRREGIERAKERIRPILRLARERGAHVHFDMEHYDAKDLTLALFRDLLSEDEFADVAAGIVIQAYLRDARDDLADLIAWSSGRRTPDHRAAGEGRVLGRRDRARPGARVDAAGVRGQGRDRRQLRALRPAAARPPRRGAGRVRLAQPPLARLRGELRPPPGRPRPRLRDPAALRHGRARARRHQAARAAAARVRPGRRAGAGHGLPRAPPAREHVQRELRPPPLRRGPRPRRAASPPPTVDEIPGPTQPPVVAPTDPRRAGALRARAAARVAARLGPRRRSRVAVDEAATARRHRGARRSSTASRCTPRPRSPRSIRPRSTVVVATSASCTAADADRAVAAAVAAAPGVARARRPSERAGLLFRAADWMRERRDELAALECFEAGKPWDQADGDVCEAIDFCEYYGREVLRLAGAAADLVQSPPGEANRLTYQGKGVTVVIAPWNFPLAIPCGHDRRRARRRQPRDPEAGRADARRGVAAGRGAARGRARRPACSSSCPGSARTSALGWSSTPTSPSSPSPARRPSASTSTGWPPSPQPGQRHMKRVVCELGGKNALIIDDDADPDQAVPGGGLLGLRLRRPEVLGGVAAHRRRLASTTRSSSASSAAREELLVGHPATTGRAGRPGDRRRRPRAGASATSTQAPSQGTRAPGPRRRARRRAGSSGRPSSRSTTRRAPIATEEIFGPVLAVLRARDFDHALELANATDYALTAGCFSRSPGAPAAGRGRAAGRQRLPQPPHHRRGRRPPALRRLRHVRHRLQGRRPRLPPPVPRPQGVSTENTLRQGFAPE